MRLQNLPWRELLHKEWAGLVAGRAFWALLLVQALLTGFSYRQALALYGEASRAALTAPTLAFGLVPLEGVLVPTFGSLYLGLTLLFPFVAIRQLARERSEGMLLLLLQTRVPLSVWLVSKLLALAMASLLLFAIPGSALLFWIADGGHLAGAETGGLLLGYGLYGFAIAGMAYLAASIMESSAGAAILTLAVTLGTWALDFALGQSGAWSSSVFSLTAALRRMESGLLCLSDAISLIALGGTALVLAGHLLKPRCWTCHWHRSGGALVAAGVLLWLAAVYPSSWDVSDNRRHSFDAANTAMLSQIRSPLRLTVHLNPDDPRLMDMQRDVLLKLRRTLSNAEIVISPSRGQGDDRYGLIELDLLAADRQRHETTYSSSAKEILPLIYRLASVVPVPVPATAAYPGYPLVANATWPSLWFFLLLPLLIISAGWRWGRH